MKNIFLLFIFFSTSSLAQEMTANQAYEYWSDKFSNGVPSYSFDYEIDEWASKNNLKFEVVVPSDNSVILGKYLYQAKIGKFKVHTPGWECDYQFIVINIWLNEFKQSGSYSVGRASACDHGRT